MRLFVIISGLMLLGVASARAHDPYEITSVVYVRSNVIELFCEMEFPAGMRLAGVEPVRDVTASKQFEKARQQLYVLAGSFFELTAGTNAVFPLTTNVELGAEEHIRFKLEYSATSHRPLQFSPRGLRGVTDAPYATSLTMLDMVNQKVLGQTTLFADSPRAEFPPHADVVTANVPEPLETSSSPSVASVTKPPIVTALNASQTGSAQSARPASRPLTVLVLVALLVVIFAFFRRQG